MTRIAYFTAGTVGAGHLARGRAIGAALARRASNAEFRMFVPPVPWSDMAGFDAVKTPRSELRRGGPLDEALQAWAPDLLIVDLFWVPVAHLLAALGCESWLLLRRCPDRWCQDQRDAPFEASRFARILTIEPFECRVRAEPLPPIVIANPDEGHKPEELRERLGLPTSYPIDVIVHAGKLRELNQLRDDAGANAIMLTLHDGSGWFPIATWLGGADRIFCGGGYNSFWEAHWLGFADRCQFRAFPRPIDDQAARIDVGTSFSMTENGADVLARMITR